MKKIVIPVTLVVALAIVLGYKACTRPIHITGNFKSTKITLTFRSNLQKVASTHGDILELATCVSDEFFRKQDERKLAGIYLGTTVAEVEARCTFRYHLRLSDRWTLDVRSNVCIVRAPPFRPTLPVAIHTDVMSQYAASGWARFDRQEQLDSLVASMTPELQRRAHDPKHVEAVREKCRHSVGEFVKNWLLREDHWRKDRFTSIIVQFPDETEQTAPWAKDQAPVIRLENQTP